MSKVGNLKGSTLDNYTHIPVTNDKVEKLFMVTPNVHLIALTRHLKIEVTNATVAQDHPRNKKALHT